MHFECYHPGEHLSDGKVTSSANAFFNVGSLMADALANVLAAMLMGSDSLPFMITLITFGIAFGITEKCFTRVQYTFFLLLSS